MVKIELVITDAKGQKHTLPTQQLADTKNFHKFAVSENSAGVVGNAFLPIQRKPAKDGKPSGKAKK